MNNLRSNSKDGRGSGSSKYPKRVVATFPVELQQTLLSQEDREWITNESSDIAGREFHSLAEKGELSSCSLVDLWWDGEMLYFFPSKRSEAVRVGLQGTCKQCVH